MAYTMQPGNSFPLGAMVRDGGVNFCLYAKGATAVELLLFDTPDAPKPDVTLWLDPDKNRTFHYWHVCVTGLAAGQVYAYRVDGAYDPNLGLRFNPNKVLLDPYARSVVGWSTYSAAAAGQKYARTLGDLPRDANVANGRRSLAIATGQQQCLLTKQRNQLVRLGWTLDSKRLFLFCPAADCVDSKSGDL